MKIESFPEREINDKGRFFTDRLIDQCNTLRNIDTGDFPFPYYSAGELVWKRDRKGHLVETDDFEFLPIQAENNHRGLRFNLTKAIDSTRLDMEAIGLGKEALIYIKEKRAIDEDCEGK